MSHQFVKISVGVHTKKKALKIVNALLRKKTADTVNVCYARKK